MLRVTESEPRGLQEIRSDAHRRQCSAHTDFTRSFARHDATQERWARIEMAASDPARLAAD
jgi:hypothetical protein